MPEIKSAYEKAMERFQDVEPDKDALHKKQIIDEGRLLCAKKLQGEAVDIGDILSKKEGNTRIWLIEGLSNALLAQIVLPTSENVLSQIDSIKEIALEVVSQPETIPQVLSQYSALCQQYLDTKQEVTEQMQEQYTQMMQQHSPQQAAALEANFIKTMQQQIKNLDEQYKPSIQQIKHTLATLCGQEE